MKNVKLLFVAFATLCFIAFYACNSTTPEENEEAVEDVLNALDEAMEEVSEEAAVEEETTEEAVEDEATEEGTEEEAVEEEEAEEVE